MNIVDRVKNILINPAKEWEVIEKETTPMPQLITGYLLLLALIPAIGNLIGYGLIGYRVPFAGTVTSFEFGVRQAVVGFASPVLAALLAAFIINMLAESFGAQKDIRRSMQLVVYSYTPALVAGIFFIIPTLGMIGTLASIYGLYLLYIGMKPMMKVPADKHTGYFVVSLLVMVVVSIVVGIIFAAIFISSQGIYAHY